MKTHSLPLAALALTLASLTFTGFDNTAYAAENAPIQIQSGIIKSPLSVELGKIQVGDLEKAIIKGNEDFKAIDEMEQGLSKLNTNRGGATGTKGFVGEHLEAMNDKLQGKNTRVLDNNGIADLEYKGKNGHKYYKQMKIGYDNGKIDLAKYKGQTVLVQKGHPKINELVKQGKAIGVSVKEASITKEQTEAISKMMKLESAITNRKTATVVPKAIATYEKSGIVMNATKKIVESSVKTTSSSVGSTVKDILKTAPKSGSIVRTLGTAGKVAGKAIPVVAAGAAVYSVATNVHDVAVGKKDTFEAVKDVAVDTVIPAVAGVAVEAALASGAASALAGTAATVAVAAAPVAIPLAVVGTAAYCAWNYIC